MTLMGYLTSEWRHVAIEVSVFILLLATPLIFVPESPRFNLIRGNEANAKRTLTRLAGFFNKSLSFERTTLKFEDRQQNYLKQLKDFLTYTAMLKTTVLLLGGWSIIGCLSYGLTFGWSKLGGSLFTSMAISGASASLGSALCFGSVAGIGRRRTQILLFSCAGLLFIGGMPEVAFSEKWNVYPVSLVS